MKETRSYLYVKRLPPPSFDFYTAGLATRGESREQDKKQERWAGQVEGRAVRCVHDRRSWLESDYFLYIVTAEDLVDAAEDTGDIVMDMADADKVRCDGRGKS